MGELVSIIVPVYNYEKYLSKCVDSFLCQTYSNIEIILVDDGSTDGSGAICDEYRKKHDKIRVIHKPNGGVSSARNAGIDAAKGEWVTFCDSDDWFEPNAVEHLLAAAKKYHTDLVSPRCVGHFVSLTGEPQKDEYDPDDFISEMANDNVSESFHTFFDARLLFSTGCRLYRANVIREFGVRFNESSIVLEDFDFNLSFLSASLSAVHIDTLCYHYLVVDRSSYAKKRTDCKKLFASIARIQSHFFQFLNEKSVSDRTSYYNFIAYYWILLINAIAENGSLTAPEKEKYMRDICSEAKRIDLSKHYDPSVIERKYRIVFTHGSLFGFRLFCFLQALKRRF